MYETENIFNISFTVLRYNEKHYTVFFFVYKVNAGKTRNAMIIYFSFGFLAI